MNTLYAPAMYKVLPSSTKNISVFHVEAWNAEQAAAEKDSNWTRLSPRWALLRPGRVDFANFAKSYGIGNMYAIERAILHATSKEMLVRVYKPDAAVYRSVESISPNQYRIIVFRWEEILVSPSYNYHLIEPDEWKFVKVFSFLTSENTTHEDIVGKADNFGAIAKRK